MGSALSAFTDFFTHSTGPAILSGPDQIINDAQLRNYEGLDMLQSSKREVQGGSQIKDVIMFSTNGQAEFYQPGDTGSVTNSQDQTTITVNWRFSRVPITWTEAEVTLNGATGSMSREAVFHQYKNLRDSKEQSALTDHLNLLERNFWSTPSNADMEADSGKKPYSILSSITSDGLAPSGFTTVQGVNPTSQSNWRNQTATYDKDAPFDDDTGLIAGFDNIGQLVQFKLPPSAVGGNASKFTASGFDKLRIATNKEGRRDFMKALRANNDITRQGPQDPAYGSPVFNAIPVVWAEALDDQSQFTAGSPDYLFINMNFIKLICHANKWMDKSAPLVNADKPDTTVVWSDLYCNVFNCSRKRHGYLQGT